MSHAALMSSSASARVAAAVAKAPSASAARPQSALPPPPPPQRRPALMTMPPMQMRRPSLSSPSLNSRLPAPPAAAAGGSADSDPYKFLGIPASADSAAISRAYNTLKRGPKRFDDKFMAQLEAAHGQIMMQQLSARLAGGAAAAAPDARFADRGTYFPWRPRRYEAESKHKLYSGAVLAALALSGIYSPTAGTQPVVAAAVVGTVANILKQNSIFPPASSPEASPEAKAQGAKNIGRAMVLSVIATFLGCAALFTVPDSVAALFGKSLPVVFYEAEKALLAIGACAANWVMTSYFR